MPPFTPRKARYLKRLSDENDREEAMKKSKLVEAASDQSIEADQREEVNEQLPTPTHTPTKKRKRSQQPESITPPEQEAEHKQRDIYARAAATLKVVSSYDTLDGPLIGREDEAKTVRAFLDARLANESSARKSLYVSGPPGIGKTALVAQVLNAFVRESNCDANLVMENCASSGKDIWNVLSERLEWNTLCGTQSEFEKALKKDMRTIILCLDEIDHLVQTCGQATLNAFFQLAHRPQSNLVLIGIANALDLTFKHLDQKLFSAKSESDSPLLLPFRTYDAPTLSKVVEDRLRRSEVDSLVDERALDFAAKKVASASGDVRVLFAVVRNALSIVSKQVCDAQALDIGQAPKVTMQFMLGALRLSGLASLPALSSKLADLTLPARCALLSIVVAVRRQELEVAMTSNKSTRSDITVSASTCFSTFRTLLSRSALSGLNVASMTQQEYLGLIEALESASIVSMSRDKKATKLSPSSRRFKPVTASSRTKSSSTSLTSGADDKQIKLILDRIQLEDGLEEEPKDASNAIKVVVELSRTLLNDERARTAAMMKGRDRSSLGDEDAPREYSTAGLDMTKNYIGARK